MAEAAWPKGPLDMWRELVERTRLDDRFDHSLEPEVQTDKKLVKIIPCQFCQRPLVVTTFYVMAWAKCGVCRGDVKSIERGSQEVVQAGRTDPALAVDLTKTLINPTFARALCPVHPDDEEHVMELKTVSHNDNYGPGEWISNPKTGDREYRQIAPGETVMHQCLKCRAVVSYSTTVMAQFKRKNEPRTGGNSNAWGAILETRETV